MATLLVDLQSAATWQISLQRAQAQSSMVPREVLTMCLAGARRHVLSKCHISNQPWGHIGGVTLLSFSVWGGLYCSTFVATSVHSSQALANRTLHSHCSVKGLDGLPISMLQFNLTKSIHQSCCGRAHSNAEYINNISSQFGHALYHVSSCLTSKKAAVAAKPVA